MSSRAKRFSAEPRACPERGSPYEPSRMGTCFCFSFPSAPQRNGCPTLAGLLFFRLGWDSTNLYLAVILSDRSAAMEAEGPASAFRSVSGHDFSRAECPPHFSRKTTRRSRAGAASATAGRASRGPPHTAVSSRAKRFSAESRDLLLFFATLSATKERVPHPCRAVVFPARVGLHEPKPTGLVSGHDFSRAE
jgi:hypothetical protein